MDGGQSAYDAVDRGQSPPTPGKGAATAYQRAREYRHQAITCGRGKSTRSSSIAGSGNGRCCIKPGAELKEVEFGSASKKPAKTRGGGDGRKDEHNHRGRAL